MNSCNTSFGYVLMTDNALGRIAGIIHSPADKKQNVRFGLIEFVDDKNVSRMLLDTVEIWAKNHGANCIYGPLGFSDLDPQGLLVEGFDQLSNIGTQYHFSYYKNHFELLNYQKTVISTV